MAVAALMYNSNSMDCHPVQKAFYSDLLGSQNNLVWSFTSSCDHSNNLYKDFFFSISWQILGECISKKTLYCDSLNSNGYFFCLIPIYVFICLTCVICKMYINLFYEKHIKMYIHFCPVRIRYILTVSMYTKYITI